MLKRIYARVSLVLFVLILVSILLCWIFSSHYTLPVIFACLAVLLFFIALVIRILKLKCPSCGKGYATPQWSKSGTWYCPRCGKPFVYDK